ncbi:hypothetical protein EAI_07213 [Harpegnathos saltator]|uniref:Fibronectin type III domain-containing protein n=1 Tax=Harpegnathos saltator TaxID=610380 RepID=E2B9R3_HARSA|nr:hypothetical protein EAI_07213 [Harpegnathos saltator]
MAGKLTSFSELPVVTAVKFSLWREAIDLEDIGMLRSHRANITTPMEVVRVHTHKRSYNKAIDKQIDDVTKIEVVLEEAPDAVIGGSMSSELVPTSELNSTFPDGVAGTGAVVVRAEEALIVMLVLVLWVAAIALFFNRWGKIRMLEPYQPKFQQQHRQQSCSLVDPNPLQVISDNLDNVPLEIVIRGTTRAMS